MFEGGAIVWYRDTNTRVLLKRIGGGELVVDEREKTPIDHAVVAAGVAGKIFKAFIGMGGA
ncbi:MAG: hypothetical protein QNJ65_12200 [Xenococcaceae cyanobacterium MO_234.B1]|nr:hypothetical protein [Xenococcaceae cyanobacterium MO_234.B1]